MKPPGDPGWTVRRRACFRFKRPCPTIVSRAYPDHMTESVDPDAGTVAVREIASALRDLQGFEISLRRRTEGITWLVWGVVLAGIVTATWGIEKQLELDPTVEHSLFLPWYAWSLLGSLAVIVVWKSAGLASHRLAGAGRHAAIQVGLLFALPVISFLGVGVFLRAGLTDLHRLPGLFTVWGVLVAVLGLSNVMRLTPTGRKALVTVGLAQAAASVAVGVADLSLDVEFPLLAMGSAGFWLLAGGYEALRG